MDRSWSWILLPVLVLIDWRSCTRQMRRCGLHAMHKSWSWFLLPVLVLVDWRPYMLQMLRCRLLKTSGKALRMLLSFRHICWSRARHLRITNICDALLPRIIVCVSVLFSQSTCCQAFPTGRIIIDVSSDHGNIACGSMLGTLSRRRRRLGWMGVGNLEFLIVRQS